MDAMCRLANVICDSTKMINRINILKDQIRDAVLTDSRKEHSNNLWEQTTEYGYFNLQSRFEGLKTFFYR